MLDYSATDGADHPPLMAGSRSGKGREDQALGSLRSPGRDRDLRNAEFACDSAGHARQNLYCCQERAKCFQHDIWGE